MIASVLLFGAAGCGSDQATEPTIEFRLATVDGSPPPLLLFRVSATGETGTVIGGTLTRSNADGICRFKLTLSRTVPGAAASVYEQPGDTPCGWSDVKANARIDLGSPPPWGAHNYMFEK